MGDLFEREVGPEFEDNDFALVGGELLQGVLDEVAFFIVVLRAGGEEGEIGSCLLFAGAAAVARAVLVEGGGAEAGEEEGAGVFGGVASGPETEEGIVQSVFGVGEGAGEVACVEQGGGAVLGEEGLPVVVCHRVPL